LKALLIRCKNNGHHTAVDTAGNVSWQTFENVMPYVDLWLYDIKLYDDEKHRNATGTSNETILRNLYRLASEENNINIIIRIPVVPGINDDVEEIESIADMLSDLSKTKTGNIQYIESIELLPLNHVAEGKYDSLDMEYKVRGYPVPSSEFMKKLAEVFSKKGLTVKYK